VDPNQKNPGGVEQRDSRSRDLLGAAFLYVLISIAYGVWIVTHDARWTQVTAQSGIAFVVHCLAWPSLIAFEVRSLVSQF
jgi:hypothetical protein